MLVVHALGTAEISTGRARLRPTSAKKFGLVLFLALESGRRVPRSVLQELLFPTSDNKRAAHALRELLYQLRHSDVPLDADKAGITIGTELVRSDFGEILTQERLNDQQLRALEGGLLPGYAPSFSETFSHWMDGVRARVTVELANSLVKRVTISRQAGRIDEAAKIARAVLALEPFNEEATLVLAESYALAGSKGHALELLDTYRREIGLAREVTLPASILRRRIASSPVFALPSSSPVLSGRQSEMSAISAAMLAASAGDARLVALTGEPGIGKSRIASEVRNRAALDGWTVVDVRTQPGDQHRPLSTFADAIPQLLNAPGALGCSPESIGWLRRLTELDLRTTVGDGEPGGVALAISRAIRDLVSAVSEEGPLLIVVDDVQWTDDASRRLMREIITRTASHRVAVVATSRSADAMHDLSAHNTHSVTVAIGPLEADACRTIARSRMARTNDPDVVDWIVETSRGNPFFVEALAHHFEATGDRFVIPPLVNQLIDDRLRALSQPARHVLSAVVRLRKRATLARLTAVLDLSKIHLLAAMAELENADLVRMDGAVRASHWLISESDLRLCPSIVDRLIHLRIADTLAVEAQSGDPSLIWDLAEHLEAAGELERGAEALSRCAEHAERIGRARDAANLYIRSAALGVEERRSTRLLSALYCAAPSNEIDLVLRAGDELTLRNYWLPNDAVLHIALARLANEGSIRNEFARLLRIVRDLTERIHVRSQAARAFLIGCEVERRQLDVIAAHTSLQALWADPDLPEIESLRIRIIFETLVGSLACASRCAQQMVALSSGLRPDLALNLRRNASIAMLRAGEIARSVDGFQNIYADAGALGLARLQNSTALMLAHLALDVGAVAAADHWYERAASHEWDWTNTSAEFVVQSFQADVALVREDREWFRRSRMWAAQYRDGPYSARLLAWCDSIEMFAQHLDGAQFSLRMCQEFGFRGLTREFELGELSDSQIAFAIVVLARQGDLQSARQMFDEYTSGYRRGRTPLNAAIRYAYNAAFAEPFIDSDVTGRLELEAALQILQCQ